MTHATAPTDTWLSILMPTYNGAPFLEACFASLRDQELEGVEVLVVDDGSTDRTVSLVEAAARALPIRLLRPARSGNWVRSTNLALKLARGTHGCLLHQDDDYRPGRVAAVRNAFRVHPALALYTHAARYVDLQGRALGELHAPLAPGVLLDGQAVFEALLVQNFFSVPCPAFRLADARAVGGLDEQLWYTADWDLWLKLARCGPVLHDATAYASFRVHGSSQTIRRSSQAGELRRQLSTVLARHLPAALPGTGRDLTRRAAQLSLALNSAMAGAFHGDLRALLPLVSEFSRADRRARAMLWSHARIHERIASRLRAAFRARRSRRGRASV